MAIGPPRASSVTTVISGSEPPAFVTFRYSYFIPASGPVNVSIVVRNVNNMPIAYDGAYLDNVTLTPEPTSTCTFDGSTSLGVNQTCSASFLTYGNSSFPARVFGSLHSLQFHLKGMPSNTIESVNSVKAGWECTYYSDGAMPCSPVSAATQTDSVRTGTTQSQSVVTQLEQPTLLGLWTAVIVGSVVIALGIVVAFWIVSRSRKTPHGQGP